MVADLSETQLKAYKSLRFFCCHFTYITQVENLVGMKKNYLSGYSYHLTQSQEGTKTCLNNR